MKNNLMVTIIVAVIVGGLGFFGGMQYQKTIARSSGPGGQFQAQNGQGRPEGFPERTGTGSRRSTGISPVSGEILDIDGETMTVKTQDGSSKIVIYSGSTGINMTSEGSASDLKVGEEVMVIGTQDDNGTVTAQTISIGGSSGLFRGMPGGQPTTEDN